MRLRFFTSRESIVPKGSLKISDKQSDAVAYVYERAGAPYAVIFWGKANKPIEHFRYRTAEKREAAIRKSFEDRRASLAHRDTRKAETIAKAAAFREEIQIGDIFHYSFGYDETHHVYYEVVSLKGSYATVRRIAQAQQDLGYDYRHKCVPQSGSFIGEPVRVLIQDGCIKVDRHYHASKWNTHRVAGVPMGPSYQGGGQH